MNAPRPLLPTLRIGLAPADEEEWRARLENALGAVIVSPPDASVALVLGTRPDRLAGPSGASRLAAVLRDDEAAQEAAIAAGADDLLLLPCTDTVLRARVRAMIALAAARREASVTAGEERYALLAIGSNDGLWDWDLATDRIYYSPRWKEMLGFREQEVGSSIEDWLSRVVDEDVAWVDATLEQQIEQPSPEFRIEYRMRDAQGQVRWMLCRGCAVNAVEGGRAVRMAGSQTDITERKLAEEALRISEERYALAIRAANDGLWDWDITTDRIFYTPRWKEMIGHSEDEISDRPGEWLDRVVEDDLIWLEAAIEGQVGRDEEPFQIEYRIRHADGKFRWMLCHGLAIRDMNGKTVRLVGSQSDISTRKSAELRVLHDSFHDRLTGLPNRALFMDRLSQSLRRDEADCAVMLCEINRFNALADNLGPEAADEVLTQIGQRLAGCLDATDTVGRLDGALFGFLLEGIGDAALVAPRAQRIHDALADALSIGGKTIHVTARLGCVLSQPGLAQRPEDMVRDAGRAMHKGGLEGRSSIAIFSADTTDDHIDPLQLEQDLRRAIERHDGMEGEIELFYQPIVSFATGRLAGFEALMRWRHPEHGMISPARFIPLAEQTSLIEPLGMIGLEMACRQIRQWHGRHAGAAGLFMNVNVSGNQLQASDFLERVEKVLAETDVDTSAIKLEITESVILDDAEQTMTLLRRLKDMGLKLAIDDFGTGYSSLSYLHRFKFDAVKIDQSFVRAMQIRDENALIIRMISDLAQGMGCEVVAEGVESDLDAERLARLGCTYGQGFHFGQPRDAETTDRLIQTGLRIAAIGAVEQPNEIVDSSV